MNLLKMVDMQQIDDHIIKKPSKEAIVGRARLWIPISVLCQLNNTVILFGFNSANFGNEMKVNFWITNEILYEIGTHIEYLKLNRQTSVIFVNASKMNVSYL